MGSKTRYSVTSASDKKIGFDYQFYYFFFLLLDLRHGQKIGFEDKDDIHIELPNNELILLQTKHTIQVNSSGEPTNLTELDSDLWKTLYNWLLVLKESLNPDDFIKNTNFQLVSNKNLSTNPFITNLTKAQNKEITTKDFKDYLRDLLKKTKDATIKKHIQEVVSLNISLLRKFLNKIKFDLNQDDLIVQIKKRLLEKIHIPERINDVYDALHSELRNKEYLTFKDSKKLLIGFEEFNTNFGKCFRKGLSAKLPIRSLSFTLPSDPKNQRFIKELIDIGDIDSDDTDEIIQFTTQMLQLYNNLKSWEENGDLLVSERDEFNGQSIMKWKNSFRGRFRDIKKRLKLRTPISVLDDEIKTNAIACLDEMRKEILKIDDTLLSLELSNGHFYLLTEEKKIGWHLDWENRY